MTTTAADYFNLDDLLEPRPPVVAVFGPAFQVEHETARLLLEGHPVLTVPTIPGLTDAGRAALAGVRRRLVELCDEVRIVGGLCEPDALTRDVLACAAVLGRPVVFTESVWVSA